MSRAYRCIGGPWDGELRAHTGPTVLYAAERIAHVAEWPDDVAGFLRAEVIGSYVESFEYRLKDHQHIGPAWIFQPLNPPASPAKETK